MLSPWGDLQVKPSGTHLGILVGRSVTLGMLWEGPIQKAHSRINTHRTLVRSLSLPMRILFTNVFIVSLFSYIALFFVLPEELWRVVRSAILSLFPFNGTAYPYEALVCGKQIFSIKPALKDVWAFNISLLAVRTKLFKCTTVNYFDLPHVDFRSNMRISLHRDSAAVDLFRSRHLPDGTIVPLSPPTSAEAYKVIVEDVYLEDAVKHCNKKLSNFLSVNFAAAPSLPSIISPTASLFDSISSNLRKVAHAPQRLLFHHMALVSNALATSRRRRHQDKLEPSEVAVCFYCGSGQDSLVHLYCYCPIVFAARKAFLAQLGLPLGQVPTCGQPSVSVTENKGHRTISPNQFSDSLTRTLSTRTHTHTYTHTFSAHTSTQVSQAVGGLSLRQVEGTGQHSVPPQRTKEGEPSLKMNFLVCQ